MDWILDFFFNSEMITVLVQFHKLCFLRFKRPYILIVRDGLNVSILFWKYVNLGCGGVGLTWIMPSVS